MAKTNSAATIQLDSAIGSGDSKIQSIELRKPMAGELRGIKLLDVLQMDVSAYMTLLPRITTPCLTETQVSQLDPVDLIKVMTGVQDFFVKADTPQT